MYAIYMVHNANGYCIFLCKMVLMKMMVCGGVLHAFDPCKETRDCL
jgi:hypothetical protein